MKCIYSDRQIDLNRFSLDHYLPWSFVAHDRLWNLIPTFPEINSAKSDRLPTSEDFDRFVALQHRGLIISDREQSAAQWSKTIAEYSEDLGIAIDELRDLDKLKTAYSRTISPLLSLATNQGFSIWERGKSGDDRLID